MLHISEAINIMNDGHPHEIEYVSKKDGHIVRMQNAVVTSSNFERKKFNVKNQTSKQIRWVYYLLIIKLDGEEVYL